MLALPANYVGKMIAVADNVDVLLFYGLLNRVFSHDFV